MQRGYNSYKQKKKVTVRNDSTQMVKVRLRAITRYIKESKYSGTHSEQSINDTQKSVASSSAFNNISHSSSESSFSNKSSSNVNRKVGIKAFGGSAMANKSQQKSYHNSAANAMSHDSTNEQKQSYSNSSHDISNKKCFDSFSNEEKNEFDKIQPQFTTIQPFQAPITFTIPVMSQTDAIYFSLLDHTDDAPIECTNIYISSNEINGKLQWAPKNDSVESQSGDVIDVYLQLLKKWRLSKFIDVFVEKGWDDVKTWKYMTEDIMANTLGFELGHIHKFRLNYNEWCNENEIEIDEQKPELPEIKNEALAKYEEHDLKLHGNWNDRRPTFGAPATWTKDNNNMVRLHGVISMKANYHNELVAALPKQAHPTRFIRVNRVDSVGVTVNICIYCSGSGYGKSGEIKVRGNKAKYMGAGGKYISLNGISWYTAADEI